MPTLTTGPPHSFIVVDVTDEPCDDTTKGTSMQRITTPRRAALALTGLLVAAGATTAVAGTAAADFSTPCVGKVIHVKASNTTVHGTCGDDIIFVSEHRNVTIYAGDGNDDIRAGWGGGLVTVHAGRGNDTVSANDKQLVVLGGPGDDVLRGAAYDDVLFGEAGNDRIYGNGGRNTIEGGDGNDVIVTVSGELGAPDHIGGGAGYDMATIDPGDTTVHVESVTVMS